MMKILIFFLQDDTLNIDICIVDLNDCSSSNHPLKINTCACIENDGDDFTYEVLFKPFTVYSQQAVRAFIQNKTPFSKDNKYDTSSDKLPIIKSK